MFYRFEEIPAPVRRAFLDRYPEASLEDWEPKHSGIMELYFELNDRVAQAQFDAEGNWLGSQLQLPESAFPSFVVEFLEALPEELLLWELSLHEVPGGPSFLILEVDEADDQPIRKFKFDTHGQLLCEWRGMVNFSRNYLN
ncbi:MAG: hypothetical protein D6722_19265 [Bacteroidetes bacterium]|nr:MAG: hypothetical protein D6722_19265 [Bacteroidota bacterium]